MAGNKSCRDGNGRNRLHSDMQTIKSRLAAAVRMLAEHSGSPALDAEVLLCHVLGKPRSHLRAWPEQNLSPSQQQAFQALVGQRRDGTPIAYLTGKREFWSREFLVGPDVLIPRPDTECLVEQCLALLPANVPCQIADLGTGSGIIAITLAAERPLTQIIAADISLPALAIARANAERHRVANVHFYHSNWFAALPKQRFDLIASNPPYLAEDDPHLKQGDVRFEPTTALVAKEQGLAAINTLADEARDWLKANGHLLVEHGYDQELAVQAIFRRYGYRRVDTLRDLSGRPRVTFGRYSFWD